MLKHKLKDSAKHYPKHHLFLAIACLALLGVTVALTMNDAPEKKRIVVELDNAVDKTKGETVAQQPDISEINSPESQPNPMPMVKSPTIDLPVTVPQLTQIEEPLITAPSIKTTENKTQPALTIAEPSWRKEVVRKGDTLSHLFKRKGLSATTLHKLTNSSKEIKSALSNLNPGQSFLFDIDDDGNLNNLKYQVNRTDSYMFSVASNGKFAFEKNERELTPYVTFAEGTIDSSLFLSAQQAGLPESTTMELANIFGWDIDFALDIRKGDHFKLIYEELFLDGEKIKNGDILAAQFTNQGETFTAIRYKTSDKGVSYFDLNGESMRKAFLRSPIDFARISSHFNLRRKHPVLHTIRAHKGTDYAASSGTPIKATGDGKVVFAGWKGGYGRVVILQHGQTYKTLYAHLSSFKRGTNVGKRIRQGQVIGYVGSSGLATGPHLHYEFYVNGSVRNPVTVKLPNADGVSAADKADFLAHSKSISLQLESFASSKQRTLAKAD